MAQNASFIAAFGRPESLCKERTPLNSLGSWLPDQVGVESRIESETGPSRSPMGHGKMPIIS
jgi:hypothetical protein